MSERGGRVVPAKYEGLRSVSQYDRFIHDMADLKPFPEQLSVEYIGHAQSVRALDVSPCGKWLATGSDDGTVRVFEVDSGRKFFRHSLGAVNRVEAVQFNSLSDRLSLFSMVCLHRCYSCSFLVSVENHKKHVLAPIQRIRRQSKPSDNNEGGSCMII